ncbi:MAG: hypothetical protein WB526_05150 [Candidatus Cybelea sp.]
MSGSLRSVIALVLVASGPAVALAQSHASGHVPGGTGGHPSGGSGRVSTPSAPAAPPAPSQHGFSFPNESNVRPIPPPRPVAQPVSNGTGANRAPTNYVHSPVNGNVTGGPYRGQFHGRVIHNPRRWGGWGWNRGIHWYPAPIYWGGGFWGPFAFGGLGAGLLFGSIIDYQDQSIYPSYQIEPSSPGAELLENYGLQQTECGPPNLVVIWGPDNSVICAYPNDLVGAGNYELDPTTLTIVSQS